MNSTQLRSPGGLRKRAFNTDPTGKVISDLNRSILKFYIACELRWTFHNWPSIFRFLCGNLVASTLACCRAQKISKIYQKIITFVGYNTSYFIFGFRFNRICWSLFPQIELLLLLFNTLISVCIMYGLTSYIPVYTVWRVCDYLNFWRKISMQLYQGLCTKLKSMLMTQKKVLDSKTLWNTCQAQKHHRYYSINAFEITEISSGSFFYMLLHPNPPEKSWDLWTSPQNTIRKIDPHQTPPTNPFN